MERKLCACFFCLYFAGTTLCGGADKARITPGSVTKALVNGRKYLGGLCAVDESIPSHGYPLGARALYAAALVSSGQGLRDPVVKKLFQKMGTMHFRKVYSVTLYVIALDCYFKAIQRLYGEKKGPRFMTGQMRKELQKGINWIIRAQGRNCDGWSYLPLRKGRTFDLSNTQFAVLALGIGCRHGLKIPPDIVNRFIKSQLSLQVIEKKVHETSISYYLDLANPGGRPLVSRLSGNPGGWGYSRKNCRPYFAMTAATLGNLFIAEKLRKSNRQGVADIIPAKKRALLWLDLHWKELSKQHKHVGMFFNKNYYYTVWSLEKACDLGEVALLGETDWYREEAGFLLSDQNDDGSWGKGDLCPVATAFALLFLSRAAASRPVVNSAPSLFTGPGSDTDRDRVFIQELKGYLSAKEFFTYLKDTKDLKLLKMAEKVFDAYSVDYREDLVPYLADLLVCDNYRIRAFSSTRLREITGLSSLKPETVAVWYNSFQEIVTAEQKKDTNKLKLLIKKNLSSRLFRRLLGAIKKIGARELVPDLVAAFPNTGGHDWPRLHKALCFLTGRSEPYKGKETAELWKRILRE